MNGEDGAGTEAALCEIGSIPLPESADLLITAVASFQANYGEFHPYIAAVL